MSKIEQIRTNIRNQLQSKKDNQIESSKRRNKKWNRFYQAPEWKSLRQWKIIKNPICETHLKYGIVVPATSIHHKHPFGFGETEEEKWKLLLDPLNLISVCESCHDEFHKQLNAKHIQSLDSIVPVDCEKY